MEKERIQPARNSRTIQQRDAGSANIMDNRPDGSRNYLSGHPLQRVEDDEEDDVVETAVQRIKRGNDCNIIQNYNIPGPQMALLNAYVPPKARAVIDGTLRAGSAPAPGTPTGTKLKYLGRPVFHITVAKHEVTVFYTYDAVNTDVLIVGIGFHAGKKSGKSKKPKKQASNHVYSLNYSINTRRDVNLETDTVW